MEKKNQIHLHLVYNDEGDWAGIYLDGRLVYEGHNLTPEQVLDTLSVAYDRITDVEIPLEIGHLPIDMDNIHTGTTEKRNQTA